MRVCLISSNRFHNDRRSVAHFESLKRSGHDVVVVSVGPRPATGPVTATVTPQFGLSGKVGGILRRAKKLRDNVVLRRSRKKSGKFSGLLEV